MADAERSLLFPAPRGRPNHRALGCLPSGAHGDVTFSLEPPCEEDGEHRQTLDACFLCRRPLRASSDVFMYRGDTPFCSEECRQQHMELEAARERENMYRRRRHHHHHRRVASVKQVPAPSQQSLHAQASDAMVAT